MRLMGKLSHQREKHWETCLQYNLLWKSIGIWYLQINGGVLSHAPEIFTLHQSLHQTFHWLVPRVWASATASITSDPCLAEHVCPISHKVELSFRMLEAPAVQESTLHRVCLLPGASRESSRQSAWRSASILALWSWNSVWNWARLHLLRLLYSPSNGFLLT